MVSDVEIDRQEAEATTRFQIYWLEGKLLVWRAVPLILRAFIFNFQRLATVMIIGNFGDPKFLAGLNLGFTFINITTTSVVFGLQGSLETLCSQAFTANPFMTSIFLQRGILVSSVVSIVMQTSWTQVGRVLIYFGYDPEVAHLSQTVLNVYVVGLIPNVIYFSMQKFLYAQGIFYAPVYIQMATVPFSIFLQWYMVYVNNLGIIGAPIAMQVADSLGAILICLYARFIDGYQVWGGFSWEAFKDLKAFLKLSLWSMLQFASTIFGIEFCTLLAGRLSVEILASQGILMSTWVTLFRMYYPIGSGAGNRVGNILGRGPAESHKVVPVTIISVIVTLATAGTVVILMMIFRYQWAALFTQDQRLIQLLGTSLFYFMPGFLFDACQQSLSGVLRGGGFLRATATISLLGYYICAIPIAYFGAFYFKFGQLGIVAGLVSGMVFSAVASFIFTLRIDWKQAAIDAQVRSGVNVAEQQFSISQYDKTQSLDESVQSKSKRNSQETGNVRNSIDVRNGQNNQQTNGEQISTSQEGDLHEPLLNGNDKKDEN